MPPPSAWLRNGANALLGFCNMYVLDSGLHQGRGCVPPIARPLARCELTLCLVFSNQFKNNDPESLDKVLAFHHRTPLVLLFFYQTFFSAIPSIAYPPCTQFPLSLHLHLPLLSSPHLLPLSRSVSSFPLPSFHTCPTSHCFPSLPCAFSPTVTHMMSGEQQFWWAPDASARSPCVAHQWCPLLFLHTSRGRDAY